MRYFGTGVSCIALHCIALHVVCMQVFSEGQLVLSSSVGLENISCLLTQNQEATHSRNVSSVGLLLAKFAEWNGLLRNL